MVTGHHSGRDSRGNVRLCGGCGVSCGWDTFDFQLSCKILEILNLSCFKGRSPLTMFQIILTPHTPRLKCKIQKMSGFCKCTSTLNRISSGPNIDRRQDMSQAARLAGVSLLSEAPRRVFTRAPREVARLQRVSPQSKQSKSKVMKVSQNITTFMGQFTRKKPR